MRRLAALAVAGASLGLLAMYLNGPVTPARTFASHLLLVAVPLVAAVTCWGTSLRRVGRWRLSWRLFAAGAASWSAASVVWWAYDLVAHHDPPFPSAADAFYLLSPLLITTGLIVSPRFGTRRAAVRSTLDGVMSAAALLVVVWPVHYAHGIGPDALTSAVAFAYPASNVLLLVAAAAVFVRLFRREPQVPGALLAFAVVQATTDSVYGFVTAGATYETGHVIDLGWFASFALLTLAARRARRVSTALPAEHLSAVSHLLPLAPVATALVSLAMTGRAGPGRLLATLVVVATAGARQYLLAREHARLSSNLEREVVARSAELTARERAYGSLVHNSSDVIALVDGGEAVTFASDAVEGVLGYAATAVVGTSITELVHVDDLRTLRETCARLDGDSSETVECRVRHAAGTWVFTECRLRREPDGAVLANVRDVSARRVLEDKLRHLALTDVVTGLASRAALMEHLEQRSRRGVEIAVVLIDLDDFKVINDTAGHAAGDHALREVAERISAVAGPESVVARLGGDEFAIAVSGVGAGAAAGDVAHRVVAALAAPLTLVDRSFAVGASVGVAANAGDGAVSDLLRHADLAMYAAKRNGKNQVALFTEDLHDAAVQFRDVREQLRDALAAGELVAHYQPIVRTKSGELHGFEALVRWQHRERGLVAPGAFLAVAESTGQIVDIGTHMLDEACGQLAAWHRAHPVMDDVGVSVNVDPQQLVESFVDHVQSVLTRHGLAPRLLTLEITERAFERHDETVEVLLALRDVGVRLALDDFGTGYSSLARLHDVPMDRVKIDRSFITQIRSGSAESPLAVSALALCQALRVEAVAEGVETPEQLAFLQGAGCELSQGYLFAAPLAPDAAAALLADIAARRVRSAPAPEPVPAAGPILVAGGLWDEDPEGAVDALLGLARDVTGFEAAYVTEIDQRRATQHVRRVSGGGEVRVFDGLSVAWDAALCRKMLDADLDFVPDIAGEFPGTALAADVGIRAFACIPLRRDEQLLGTLCVANPHPGHVDTAAIGTLRHLGRLLAQSMGGGALRESA